RGKSLRKLQEPPDGKSSRILRPFIQEPRSRLHATHSIGDCTMRRQSRTLVVALSGLLPLALGMRVINQPIDVQPESRLWVTGTSSTRSWECKATSFDAVVQSGGAGAVATILGG